MRQLFLKTIMAAIAVFTPSAPCFGQIVVLGSAGPLTGDVNGDDEVNITDINVAIDLLMGEGYTHAADVNSN